MNKILPLFLIFLFFSCAEDDVDTMKLQSVYTEIEITNCQSMSFNITSAIWNWIIYLLWKQLYFHHEYLPSECN